MQAARAQAPVTENLKQLEKALALLHSSDPASGGALEKMLAEAEKKAQELPSSDRGMGKDAVSRAAKDGRGLEHGGNAAGRREALDVAKLKPRPPKSHKRSKSSKLEALRQK
mmetsp:Transcript_12466/g.35205  ORF Transcript_12466/g.35205 Transcript_12466/m.35205 type:complete len:112 (+) Transcript_12466:74-409(+)